MAAVVALEFDGSVQSLEALHAAAYRLIGKATCEIKKTDTGFECLLTSNSRQQEAEELKRTFLELLADENLRETVNARTEGVRNLILSLACGSLAAQQNDRP
jgi:His-Xaa-Ser system protein HxsD